MAHTHETHAHWMHAYQMYSREMHACEIYGYEVYAHRSVAFLKGGVAVWVLQRGDPEPIRHVHIYPGCGSTARPSTQEEEDVHICTFDLPRPPLPGARPVEPPATSV
jgi:hypothetical protein